jgi:hypothetical protein
LFLLSTSAHTYIAASNFSLLFYLLLSTNAFYILTASILPHVNWGLIISIIYSSIPKSILWIFFLFSATTNKITLISHCGSSSVLIQIWLLIIIASWWKIHIRELITTLFYFFILSSNILVITLNVVIYSWLSNCTRCWRPYCSTYHILIII